MTIESEGVDGVTAFVIDQLVPVMLTLPAETTESGMEETRRVSCPWTVILLVEWWG